MAKVSHKQSGVERIFNFKPKGIVGLPDEGLISEKNWKELTSSSLVLIRGMDILQYADEYPIVRYQSKSQEADASLNTFVKSVTVSTGVNGRCVSAFGQSELTPSKYETLFYYEDSFGLCHSIVDDEVCKFLLTKPRLMVSPEGALVFFTKKDILATIDCQHFTKLVSNGVVSNKDFDRIINSSFGKEKKIHSIKVESNKLCKIHIVDDNSARYFLFKLQLDFRNPNIMEIKYVYSYPRHFHFF